MSRAPTRSNRLIESETDIRTGVRALRRKCEVMRSIYAVAGEPPLRRRMPGFEGLARIVVGQQLSVASAGAIWSRFEIACAPVSATRLLTLDEPALRAAGLSGPKIRTLRAAAEAVAAGLDLERLAESSDTDVHEALTAIPGIGPWTADIYIMFCLGRADGFAAGDLALQIAAQRAFALDARPDPTELTDLAERWRPWRGVAARMLWAYYAAVKTEKPAQPV